MSSGDVSLIFLLLILIMIMIFFERPARQTRIMSTIMIRSRSF